MVLGSILDEPRLGVRGRRPARAFLLAASRSSFQRAEAQVPVVADRREKEEISLRGAWPFGVCKSQGHTSRVFKLETGEECGLVFW